MISGSVQGVFFRASASRFAQQLKLKGFVRNLPSGCVELIAEGEEEALKMIIEWCQKGPSGAQVENVEVKWSDAIGQFKDFHVR